MTRGVLKLGTLVLKVLAYDRQDFPDRTTHEPTMTRLALELCTRECNTRTLPADIRDKIIWDGMG